MEKRAKVIKIETPNKFQLNGLWFGGNNPSRVLVFIHGLTSNAFSNHELLAPLADEKTAVIYFSNRGAEKIARFKKTDKRSKKGYKSYKFGEAKETFTDCVDDIQGVVDFVKNKEVKEIYLVGHSTGCQKSLYYLSQKGKQKQATGVVLLCPVSDYSAITLFITKQKLNKIVKVARKMIKEGKSNELIPFNVWPHYHEAQRFISLYTPESEEEIFPYASNKEPTTLTRIIIPMLTIYAGKDEYHDRPTKEIANWFRKNSKPNNLTISIVKNAPHNFNKHQPEVVKEIGKWLSKRS